MTKNTILFQRGLVNLPERPNDKFDGSLQFAMSLQNELMNLGYMLDNDAFQKIKYVDPADLMDFHTEIVNWFNSITGNGKTYTPLFEGFPRKVLSLSDSVIRHLQIVHYWTHKTFILNDGDSDNGGQSGDDYLTEPAWEKPEYKIIKWCSHNDFLNIFTDLCSVNNSLTPSDLQTLVWFQKNYPTELVYPSIIPFKENLATLALHLPSFTVKTVTDVLGISVSMSGGDVALLPVPKKRQTYRGYRTVNIDMEPFKFKLNDSNKNRLLDLFESSNLDVRDMNAGRKYARFIKLAEHLGIGKNTIKSHPLTTAAFNILRNQKRKGKVEGFEKIRTWNSQVEQSANKGISEVLAVLVQRPGEFLRRLNWLFIKYPSNNDRNLVLKSLYEVGKDSSNKVLFETLTYFEGRNVFKNRSILPKGSRKPVALKPLEPLPQDLIDQVSNTIWNSITCKFSLLEPLGKCWVDPELKKIPLPTNMRSLSESLVTVLRGQRMPIGLDNPKVLRAYCFWKDFQGTFDLDLSATFAGEKVCAVLNYSNQRYGNSVHSGDIRHRKGDCAEYIDIDVADSLGKDTRYVIIDVRDFNSSTNGLSDKNAYFGFAAQEFPEIGLNFIPNTLQNAIKLTSTNTGTMLCILDLQEMEYIWLDLDTDNNTAHNPTEALKLINNYAELPKISVFDLLAIHVSTRGEFVNPEDADKVFTFDEFKSSYVETMKYMGI